MHGTNDYLVLNGEKVSPETLKPLGAPPPEKRGKPLWLRLIIRHPIWVYVILVGGTGAILSHYWRIVERIAPPLNEFIHREVSDKNDAQYQLYKLRRTQKRYISETAVCYNADTAFAACRSAMLTSKTDLADMERRVSRLQAGWKNEAGAKQMPQECRDAGTGIYDALADYVAHDRQISDVFESADPTSEVSVAKAKEQLDQLAHVEEQATVQLHNMQKWPKGCEGF